MQNNIKFFVPPHILAHADKKEPILLALSGGADSACLLHLLADYSARTGCRLYAAHLNHNIRTAAYLNEAERDEQFCRDICRRAGVELFVYSIDVPELAQRTGKSLETAARDARYSFFAEIMKTHGIKILATAHNADDNLETQIFNLCRGCSTDGLVGIPRVRGFDAVEAAVIVRPILDASKSEIVEFCNTYGIGFVTDSTNLEDDCTRNRIRHRVIPELVSLFGNPQKASIRLSRSAEQDATFIRAYAERFISDFGGRIPLDELCALDPPVYNRVLSMLFHRVSGESLETVHLDAIDSIVSSKKEGASVSLPHRIRAAIANGYLVFENDTRQKSESVRGYEIYLKKGLNFIEDCPFAVLISHGDNNPSPPKDLEPYASACLFVSSENLTAKNRSAGDTIIDGGMHKSLKKLMCDKKINAYERDMLPIIYEDGEILYAPRCAISDSAKKHTNKNQISISIYKKPYKCIHRKTET